MGTGETVYSPVPEGSLVEYCGGFDLDQEVGFAQGRDVVGLGCLAA